MKLTRKQKAQVYEACEMIEAGERLYCGETLMEIGGGELLLLFDLFYGIWGWSHPVTRRIVDEKIMALLFFAEVCG